MKVEQVSTKFDQNQVAQSETLSDLHDSPVRLIRFNHHLGLAISTDTEGNIEIWDPESHELPSSDDDTRLQFDLLSETDYYALVQDETYALEMQFDQSGQFLAIYARDYKIRVFHFTSGRIVRTFDEGL